jgi:hypothetical protein
MLKGILLFVLDGFPEVDDGLVIQNRDLEDVTSVIAEHQTIKFELWFRGRIWASSC